MSDKNVGETLAGLSADKINHLLDDELEKEPAPKLNSMEKIADYLRLKAEDIQESDYLSAVKLIKAADLINKEKPASAEKLYPCADCGTLRTKSEGGTVFTVCDDCWDKVYKKEQPAPEPQDDEKIMKSATPLHEMGLSDEPDQQPQSIFKEEPKYHDVREFYKDESLQPQGFDEWLEYIIALDKATWTYKEIATKDNQKKLDYLLTRIVEDTWKASAEQAEEKYAKLVEAVQPFRRLEPAKLITDLEYLEVILENQH